MHVAPEDAMTDNEKPQKAAEPKRTSSILLTLRKLSDVNSETRILAGEALLKDLSNKHGSKDEEGIHTAVEYLVKGLSSSRRCSRVGYTATLIQILQTFADVSAQDVIKCMNKHLAVDVKENRNYVMIGRALALSAIVRSGRTKGVYGDIVQDLVDIVSRSPCTEILVCEILKELFSQVKKESFRKKVWPILESSLSKGWDDCTPFTLFLLCLAAEKYPEIVGTEFLKEHWSCSDVHSKKNVQRIVAVIQSSLSTLPLVHPVCRSILEYASSKGTLAKAWNRIYGEGLLQPSTDERTYVAMELLPWCVSQLPSGEEVESIFTDQLKKVLLQAVTNSMHILHSNAQQMVQRLVSCGKESKDAGVQIALLGFFVKPPSNILFDQISKSKTVQQLLVNASSECVVWYRDFLKAFLMETSAEGVSHLGHQQSQAFEQLSHLLNLPSVQSSTELRAENLRFLVEMYARMFGGGEAPEVQSAKKHLQSAILKALAPTKKSQAADFVHLLVALLADIKEHGNTGSTMLISRSLKLVKKMERGEADDDILTSFKVLLGYLSVLVFLGICEDDSILEDMQNAGKCYVKDKGQTAEDSGWVETIMETLLNMLLMTSQAVRSVTGLAFTLISKHMTDDALQNLLSAFGVQKEEEDEQEEFDVDGDESSDSDGSGSELEEDETAQADDELRQRLKAVLGGGEDSDEDVVLTDKEMFELDDAISAAFKARMGESKSDKLVGIHFQMKCLELLREYVGSDPPLRHLVKIGSVLVAASTMPNFKSERSVISSISDTLQLISAVRKFSELSDMRKEIVKLTKDVLDQTSKVSNLELKTALGMFSAFLVLCYKKVYAHLGLKEDRSSWYLQLYTDSLKAYLEQSSHINPMLFVKFMEMHPEHCYDFIVSLEEKVSACMEKQHMRLQVFGLLVAAIRLLQSGALPDSEKTKIKKIFKKLTDTAVKALGEMAKNREVKTGMTMEFADLLLVISKQSLALGFQHPFESNEALAADLETLAQLMGQRQKPLRRRVGQVLKEINKADTTEKPKKSGKRKHQGSDELSSKKRSGKSD